MTTENTTEATSNLTFDQMLNQIENGYAYKRDSWNADQGYLMMPLGTNHVYKFNVNNGNLGAALALIDINDFRATDWREATVNDFPAPTPAVKIVGIEGVPANDAQGATDAAPIAA